MKTDCNDEEEVGQPNSTIPEQKFSTQSCDRCYTRKKSCSMHMPTCLRCETTSNLCSYNRALSRRRNTPKHKLLGLKRKPKVDKPDPDLIIDIVADRKIEGPSVKYFLRQVYIEGIQRPILTLYLSVTNLKIFSFQKEDLALILAIKEISTPNTKLIQNEAPMVKLEGKCKPSIVGYGTENQFIKAIDTYFKYINVFKPLFTKSLFFKKKRSRFLVLAVFGAGLQLMEKNVADYLWISDLYKEIVQLIKFHYFKPSLDSLQAMVIVNDSFFSVPEVFQVACKCKNIFMRFSTCIGLHKISPKKFMDSRDILIERFLCYTNILYIIGFSNMIYRDQFKSRPIYTPIHPTLDTNYNSDKYFKKILANKYDKTKKTSTNHGGIGTNCVEEDMFVYLAKCFSAQSTVSDSIRAIRSSIEAGEENSGQVQAKIYTLLKLCNEKRTAYEIKFLQFLKVKTNSTATNQLVQDVLKFNNLMFHFTTYYVLDLSFYLQDDLNLKPMRSPNTTIRNKHHLNRMMSWLEVSLSIAQLYIEFNQDYKYHPFHLYPLIVTLITLCRHGHLYSDEQVVRDTIAKGSLLVDRFRSLPSTSYLALHYSSILAILK